MPTRSGIEGSEGEEPVVPTPRELGNFYGIQPDKISNLKDLRLDMHKGNKLSEVLPKLSQRGSFKNVRNGESVPAPIPKCPEGWIPAVAVIPAAQESGTAKYVSFTWEPMSVSCGRVQCKANYSCSSIPGCIGQWVTQYYSCNCSTCGCDSDGKNCSTCCSTCSRLVCTEMGYVGCNFSCENTGTTTCSTSTPTARAPVPADYLGATATAQEVLSGPEIAGWKIILTGQFANNTATVNTFCKLDE
jgi:hypothetical protein